VDLVLKGGGRALLWNPLEPMGARKGLATQLMVKYLGPFRVTRQVSPVDYEIRDFFTGKTRVVHVQRLRPFSPWRLAHVDEVDKPSDDVPLDAYEFLPIDFTGRRRKRTHDSENREPRIMRQKIEIFVDVPNKVNAFEIL